MIKYLDELRGISEKLKEVCHKDKASIENRLTGLAVYKARVNDITPEAQHLFNENLADVSEKITERFPKATGNSSLMKNFTQAEMRDYKRVMDYCERINSTIERQSENLRSVLSSIKAELQNLNA